MKSVYLNFTHPHLFFCMRSCEIASRGKQRNSGNASTRLCCLSLNYRRFKHLSQVTKVNMFFEPRAIEWITIRHHFIILLYCMLNSCAYWKNNMSNSGSFLSQVFCSGVWYFQITSINVSCAPVCTWPQIRAFFCFDFYTRAFGWVENNKCKPLTLHSLTPYHSRQIVFTLDPTTATKDPPAHPITANQIT